MTDNAASDGIVRWRVGEGRLPLDRPQQQRHLIALDALVDLVAHRDGRVVRPQRVFDPEAAVGVDLHQTAAVALRFDAISIGILDERHRRDRARAGPTP